MVIVYVYLNFDPTKGETFNNLFSRPKGRNPFPRLSLKNGHIVKHHSLRSMINCKRWIVVFSLISSNFSLRSKKNDCFCIPCGRLFSGHNLASTNCRGLHSIRHIRRHEGVSWRWYDKWGVSNVSLSDYVKSGMHSSVYVWWRTTFGLLVSTNNYLSYHHHSLPHYPTITQYLIPIVKLWKDYPN